MVSVADDLGLTVVTEGVETIAQVNPSVSESNIH
jgi:sensor c-di-GMP phosphodiesterase-like protein